MPAKSYEGYYENNDRKAKVFRKVTGAEQRPATGEANFAILYKAKEKDKGLISNIFPAPPVRGRLLPCFSFHIC